MTPRPVGRRHKERRGSCAGSNLRNPISSTATRSSEPRPMREPVFTETMQLGIVVRDLDAAMRTYVEDYGIGPWEVYEFNPGNAKDLHEYGQPVERSWRLAVAMVGQVIWELIEPLDDESSARASCREGGGSPPRRRRHPELPRDAGGAGRTRQRCSSQPRVQRRRGGLPRHRTRPRSDHRNLQRHARRLPEARTPPSPDVRTTARHQATTARIGASRIADPRFGALDTAPR
jgi:hypothetical protein